MSCCCGFCFVCRSAWWGLRRCLGEREKEYWERFPHPQNHPQICWWISNLEKAVCACMYVCVSVWNLENCGKAGRYWLLPKVFWNHLQKLLEIWETVEARLPRGTHVAPILPSLHSKNIYLIFACISLSGGSWSLFQVCGLSSCGTWAWPPHSKWDLRFPDRRSNPRNSLHWRWILNHWATREVPFLPFIILHLLLPIYFPRGWGLCLYTPFVQ